MHLALRRRRKAGPLKIGRLLISSAITSRPFRLRGAAARRNAREMMLLVVLIAGVPVATWFGLLVFPQ